MLTKNGSNCSKSEEGQINTYFLSSLDIESKEENPDRNVDEIERKSTSHL